MDDALKERYARYKRYLSSTPMGGLQAFHHTLLEYLAVALGLDDAEPDETAYRRLLAANPESRATPVLATEQRGLLIGLTYALTQAQVTTESRYGVLTELPEEFPYRSYLVEAGVETVEALRGLAMLGPEYLQEVDGIGEERTEDVLMALAKIDALEKALRDAAPLGDEEEVTPLGDGEDEPLPPPPGGTTPSEAAQQPALVDEMLEKNPETEVIPENTLPPELTVIESEQTMTLLDEGSGVPYYDLLLKGGFASVEAVRDATDVDILDVIGIGPVKLLEIRAVTNPEPE